MLIKSEYLEIGDEFLVPSQTTFVHYKVLSKPKKADSSTFRCSTNKTKFTGGKPPYQYTYFVRHLSLDSSKHNEKESVNLAGKDLWLLKRD